jgi:hypothetical protein
MESPVSSDSAELLSRADRREWVRRERTVTRQHEADQLATLMEFAAAGGGVTGLTTAESLSDLSAPVELIIEGRRLRAARVHRPTLSALKDALASIASVPLTAASRYGPYWVLTFKLAAEPLVVLIDHLTILPDWGGSAGRSTVPGAPLAQLVG